MAREIHISISFPPADGPITEAMRAAQAAEAEELTIVSCPRKLSVEQTERDEFARKAQEKFMGGFLDYIFPEDSEILPDAQTIHRRFYEERTDAVAVALADADDRRVETSQAVERITLGMLAIHASSRLIESIDTLNRAMSVSEVITATDAEARWSTITDTVQKAAVLDRRK